MRKLSFLAIVFMCLCFCPLSLADTEMLNWCGTYFEANNQSYLRIARGDLFTGSNICDIEVYHQRIMSSGHINLALNHSKNRNVAGKWRKFTDHVIEVRGKIQNGSIIGTRLVRDIGV